MAKIVIDLEDNDPTPEQVGAALSKMATDYPKTLAEGDEGGEFGDDGSGVTLGYWELHR